MVCVETCIAYIQQWYPTANLLLLLKSKRIYLLVLFCFCNYNLFGQKLEPINFQAGFKSIVLVDSSRIYKEGTAKDDPLYYRQIELDIWYPSSDKPSNPLKFGSLFKLLEERSTRYGDEDFSGFTEEMAGFFLAELGIEASPERLLDVPTNSFLELKPVNHEMPLVIYMAGFNGMGYENYKVLERLAQEGFLVVSIWSVGRYPGNMSNKKADMMEQVMDAEVALGYIKKSKEFSVAEENIGVLGMSWGGMSSAVFVARNPKIKAFLSFDGSEMHYFGDQTDVDNDGMLNDDHIKDILDADLLKPGEQQVSYLYLESGDKLEAFAPTSEFNYYNLLNTDKKYVRFLVSKHADFTSLPSVLNDSTTAVETHKQLVEVARQFFLHELLDRHTVDGFWETLIKQDNVSTESFNYETDHLNAKENTLKGKIIDSKTKAPLPYVNIGFLYKARGTVTDEKGQFELLFNENDFTDTLRISMIGYSPKKIILKDLLKSINKQNIELDENIESLTEVVVVANAYKARVLGNKTESKFISTGFSYDQLGAEMGVKIKIKKSPTFVDSLNVHVSYNRLSARSIFRVNFYAVENGRPGENILKDNILIGISPKQTGLISVDLRPYNIILQEDTYVTLEWIKNEGINEKGEAIFFSLGMLNNATIYKPSSQAGFKKHSSLGVGFNLNVRQ